MGGWVRNTGNKAQLRPAGTGALPELGNNYQGQEDYIPALSCKIGGHTNAVKDVQNSMEISSER